MIQFPRFIYIIFVINMICDGFPSIFPDSTVSGLFIILDMSDIRCLCIIKCSCKTCPMIWFLRNSLNMIRLIYTKNIQNCRCNINYMQILITDFPFRMYPFRITHNQWIFYSAGMYPGLIPLKWCISCICPANRIMWI